MSKPAKTLPPLNVLNDNFHYDPISGFLYRKMKSGLKIITTKKQGYVRAYITGMKTFSAHRIAWKMYYQQEPPLNMQIDHINQQRDDNRIENLRLVTMANNMKNKTKYNSNSSGVTGVSKRSDVKSESWRAQIQEGRRTYKLGCYKTFDEAVAARRGAEIILRFSQNHGAEKSE
jgi:hypothetical protein